MNRSPADMEAAGRDYLAGIGIYADAPVFIDKQLDSFLLAWHRTWSGSSSRAVSPPT